MPKKRTNAYWINRSEETLANIHDQATPYIHEINKYYDKALQDLQTDINKIFQTYANNHNLTAIEAKQFLNSTISSKEIAHLRQELSTISNVDLKKHLLAQINANAYKARITRIEALKEAIAVHYTKVADKQLQLSKQAYINTMNESYYRTAFNLQKGINIGFNVAQIPTKTIDVLLNTTWSGKHYSKRIWGNSQATIDAIGNTLTGGFISGKSIPKMVKEIEDLTEYGKYAVERLVRTECTYFANMGSVESYKECDVDKYIFVATLDSRTSKQCQQHDRKIYETRKAIPGKNLPPLHTWCRSTTRAYLGEKYMNNIKRRARDPETGKTYLVDNMSYDDWHNKFVKGNPKAELAEKKIKNSWTDKKQYTEYKSVLGRDVPKSLDEFQELKYTDSKQWETLKSNYRYANMLNKKKTITLNEANRSLPLEGEPNSVTDLVENGKTKQRRIYGEDKKVIKDIDTSNHNKPKYHPMGAHKHEYNYNNRNPHGKADYFTEEELEQNRDIIKKGVNYNDDRNK